MQNGLEALRQYKEEELSIIAEAETRRYQLEAQFAELTGRVKRDALVSEITAYQSAAGSVAKLVGAGIKEQALIMIPFEIAEATKEMGNFIATKDPSHLAASLKHVLAVKQYADAAKTSHHSAGSEGHGAGDLATGTASRTENAPPNHAAQVVVNVGEGIIVQPKEFVRQLIDGLNEAYKDNVKIEFA